MYGVKLIPAQREHARQPQGVEVEFPRRDGGEGAGDEEPGEGEVRR